MRNFCSLYGSHNRKIMPFVCYQGANNTVVQSKDCIAVHTHILIPEHFISANKDWFLSKFNSGWETPVTDKATDVEVTDTDRSTPNNVAGFSDGAFPSKTKCVPEVQEHNSTFLKMTWHPAESSSTRSAGTRETDHISQACFVSRLSAFSQQSLRYHRFS